MYSLSPSSRAFPSLSLLRRVGACVLACTLAATAHAQKAPQPDAGGGGGGGDAPIKMADGEEIVARDLPLLGGDFEKAAPDAKRPAFWQRPDGLTTFWVDRPEGGGKCVKLDSTVDKEQVYAWQDELKKNPDAKPPAPRPPKGKYEAIGATYGALLWSEWYRVERDVDYVLTADVQTNNPKVFLWVKGYIQHQGYMRVTYKIRKECEAKESGGNWKTWTLRLSPTKVTKTVQYMRVQLVALWPAGVAFIDNVSLKKAGD
ncbi:MAG: hypothetical protein HY719_03620 [Planctomycetes bacterium]|nr:hypothetical protein [Planctomycetota bacterium]